MSRHPDPKQSKATHHLSRVDAYVNFVTNNAVPLLQRLARVIATQKWHEAGKDVIQYQQIKQVLSVSNGVILRGIPTIVPEKLRGRMIMLAKTKRFLRDSVWFPGIDTGGGSGQRMPAISSCKP